jgi:uncharacterized membrane protein
MGSTQSKCSDSSWNMPLCNHCPERAPHFGGLIFFLCWRCTGILLGLLLALVSVRVVYGANGPQEIIWLLVLSAPGMIDVYRQKIKGKPSNNKRRFITGLLAGISIVGWAKLAVTYITLTLQLGQLNGNA